MKLARLNAIPSPIFFLFLMVYIEFVVFKRGRACAVMHMWQARGQPWVLTLAFYLETGSFVHCWVHHTSGSAGFWKFCPHLSSLRRDMLELQVCVLLWPAFMVIWEPEPRSGVSGYKDRYLEHS